MKQLQISNTPIISDEFCLYSRAKNENSIKLVIGGHSHANAYAKAIRASSEFDDVAILLRNNRDGEYWSVLNANCRSRSVAIIWQGNQHASFILEMDRPFDFYFADEEIRAGASLVSQEIVRTHLYRLLTNLPKSIRDLKPAGANSIFVVGTPPPRGEEEDLRPLLEREPFFDRLAKRHNTSIEKLKFSPLSFRLKLWRLLQEQLREIASENGATFVPVPSALLDERGSLLREYWGDDITHANARFGVEMLKHLRSRVASE